MEYRRLGGSDLKVSAVVLGAWAIGGWMWGHQDESDAIAAIEKSIGLGVTSIDTAPVYGFGYSEELIGRVIAGKRDKVQILTKYCIRWDKAEGKFHFETVDNAGKSVKLYLNARKEDVIWECEQSLRRLGTDYIDLYQCHRRDHTTPVEETMEAVAKLIEDGKVRHAGVSNFTVEEIAAARTVVPIISDQPPYSMVKRDIEKDVLPYCMENNIGVLVYSPLQRGLLTGKFKEGHVFAPGDNRVKNRYFAPENLKKINRMLEDFRPIASAHGATAGQLVINWTIHRPGITAALVGARNAAQAAENAKAVNFKLSDEETARINELVKGLQLDLEKK
jgi:aryl-alcohol dehydrogenase-like predicted oxidoreductase